MGHLQAPRWPGLRFAISRRHFRKFEQKDVSRMQGWRRGAPGFVRWGRAHSGAILGAFSYACQNPRWDGLEQRGSLNPAGTARGSCHGDAPPENRTPPNTRGASRRSPASPDPTKCQKANVRVAGHRKPGGRATQKRTLFCSPGKRLYPLDGLLATVSNRHPHSFFGLQRRPLTSNGE